MDHRLVEGLMDAVAPYIQKLEKQCEAMQARIDQLEARAPEKGDPGPPGKDAVVGLELFEATLRALLDENVERLRGEPGEPGKDAVVNLDALALKAAELIEKPKDGAPGRDAEVDLEALAVKAAALIEKPKDGLPGLPGKDADPVDLEALAQKAAELIRVPKDGVDGVSIKTLLTDAEGQLVVTLSNGEVQRAGRVVGRDGQDGKPGEKGKDGADGLGFEDMDEFLDEDGRTVVRRYAKGDVVKEFRHLFGVPLDAGIWREGQAYKKGDGVTYSGSWWIAQKDNPQGRPDSGNKDFRLAVKKGRDGKDGSAPPPPPGPIHVPGAKSGR